MRYTEIGNEILELYFGLNRISKLLICRSSETPPRPCLPPDLPLDLALEMGAEREVLFAYEPSNASAAATLVPDLAPSPCSLDLNDLREHSAPRRGMMQPTTQNGLHQIADVMCNA